MVSTSAKSRACRVFIIIQTIYVMVTLLTRTSITRPDWYETNLYQPEDLADPKQQQRNMRKYTMSPSLCNNNDHDETNHSTTTRTKFDDIYSDGFWGSKLPSTMKELYNYGMWPPKQRMSGSGEGSVLGPNTQVSIEFLSSIINMYNIKTMIDIPCGDTNWIFDSYETDIALQLYIGLDLVSDVIKMNQQKYIHHSNKVFAVWDGAMCPLPKYSNGTLSTTTSRSMNSILKRQPQAQQHAPDRSSHKTSMDSSASFTSLVYDSVDLIHSRDVLQHLPHQIAILFLCNVFHSKAKYFITTTYPTNLGNIDISMGDFYHNNLDIEPFNLPRPTSTTIPGTSNDSSPIVFQYCLPTHPHHEPDLTCLYDLTQPWVQEWVAKKCT